MNEAVKPEAPEVPPEASKATFTLDESEEALLEEFGVLVAAEYNFVL